MNRKNRSRSPIHEESKTQKKQGKAHPKFDPNTQQGTPYLKSYIRPDAIDQCSKFSTVKFVAVKREFTVDICR